MSETDLCISCKKAVEENDHALCCDNCNQWQHQTCDTGVSKEAYESAMHNEEDLDWVCKPCLIDAGIDISNKVSNYLMSIELNIK